MKTTYVGKTIQLENEKAMVTYGKDLKIAIDNDWESLYFADNLTDFLVAESKNSVVLLTTQGSVSICDNDNNKKIYKNCDTFDIKRLLNNEDLDYEINQSNYFTVLLGQKNKSGEVKYYESIIFKAMPKTIDETIEIMKDFFSYLEKLNKVKHVA